MTDHAPTLQAIPPKYDGSQMVGSIEEKKGDSPGEVLSG